MRAQLRPCTECPWRTDVEAGRFPPERYERLAATAHDCSWSIFACHKSTEGNDVVCAGFLARGAEHNLAIRMALAHGEIDPIDRSGGFDLFADYRAMAVANGVDPADPLLEPCRGNDY